MKSLVSALLAGAAVVVAAPLSPLSDVVTIYAADGLHDGKGSWFETQFDAFTKATGVKCNTSRPARAASSSASPRRSRTRRPTFFVTLPPFISARRGRGPAADVQADRRRPDRRRRRFLPAAGQQLPELHLRFRQARRGAEDLRRPARSEVQGQDPVFDPGQAGDGTAVMLQVITPSARRTPPSTISRSCRTTTSALVLDGKLTAAGQQG